jgi:predicted GIY-YIG superfamily endonuclease
MKYVYIIESLNSEHFYVGITDDLRIRLAKQCGRGAPHIEIPSLEDSNLHRI